MHISLSGYLQGPVVVNSGILKGDTYTVRQLHNLHKPVSFGASSLFHRCACTAAQHLPAQENFAARRHAVQIGNHQSAI